jgi:PAS domain S-box-containing protein
MSSDSLFAGLNDSEERPLESQVKKLAVIADLSADAIMSVDRDGRFEFWNRGAELLLGYKKQEIIGKDFHIIVPEDLYNEAEAKRREAFEKGHTRFETHRLRKDGSLVPVDMTLTAIWDEEGNAAGVAASIKDLSTKKELEDQIKAAKKHLESIFDTIEEAICVIDRDLLIISFNEAFYKNTGTPRNQILGKKCYQVIHNFSQREFQSICSHRCTVISAFEGGTPVESVHRHENGGEFLYHESRALPIKNAEREAYQVVYIIKDITEKKRAEEELERYAKKMEKSNRLKDLFADIMSHDLLNPTGVLRNVFEIIEDYRNLNRIEELIKMATRFAQVESAEQMVFENRNLSKIIEEATETLNMAASEKNVRIQLPGGEYSAWVNFFIEDVFSNLISNAIKYSPKGGSVLIEIKSEEDNWKVSVADNGPGVLKENKKAIFERFKRAEKGSVKGSGLGLAIVKQVVELHNGEVWVEDNPGGGSIFVFTVPKRRKKYV